MKHKFLFLFVCLLAFNLSVFAQQPTLVPNKITLKTGKPFNLNLPAEYEIVPAAQGLGRVRFFAKAPDGRIFVTSMFNMDDNVEGKIYILDGWNEQTGKFSKVITYLTKLRNPNSAQFYTDKNGQDWLYIAETDKVTRRKFTKGETKPTDTKPQVVALFPGKPLTEYYKYGGWHLSRTIAFSPGGKLYVSVGSSCNACDEKTTGTEKTRATVQEMNADGTGQRTFAKGLRNAVGMKWIGGSLWATNQGSDHLGWTKPDETFYALKDGADYGWASCYQSNGKIFFDTTKPNSLKKPAKRLKSCSDVSVSYAYFPARSSALGFDYFDDPETDDIIKNAFLVSLHGSPVELRNGHKIGYKIVIMRKDEKLQDFITGFLSGKTVNGRPCDIMRLDANSFLFTDDGKGVVYYVRKKGTTTKIASIETGPDKTVAEKPGNEAASNSQTCFGIAGILLGACIRTFFPN